MKRSDEATLEILRREIASCRICRDAPAKGLAYRLPHEPRPVAVISSNARILIAGQIWLNHRRRMRQHVLETIEEEAMHVCEMTRVFVSGPPPWRRPPLENVSRHLLHERHYDIWGAAQRVNDGSDSLHVRSL